MKRTAEKVLAIISAVFTGIAVILGFVWLSVFNNAITDPLFLEEVKNGVLELEAEDVNPADLEMMFESTDILTEIMTDFSWAIIIAFIISFILTVIGTVCIWNNKKPKLAGTMFILGGLLAGIISLTSILLYIAGILSFVRKATLKEDGLHRVDDQSDGTMRPL